MADVRIHDLPSAASWNGFFPQDKPGGPTECVSVATVEAKLVEDGFVKTAMLVAGYQPLENQRLSTTDSPTFAAVTLSGIKVLPEFTYPTTDTAIYGKNITPTALNWGAWFANDGTLAGLNADNVVTLAIDGVSRVSVNAGAVNIATKLQIAGVDRITAAGGFIGTSLQISGATANKLARFDASKNLVSTDVAYSDLTGTVPTWNQNTTGNAATATKWATARNLTIGSSTQAIDGTTALTFSLAAIGALPVNNPTFTGVLNGPVVDITGAGSGTVGAGPYVGTRSGSSAGWLFQLGASNTWDLWNLAASSWTKQAAFSPGGNLVMNGAVTAGNAAMAGWAQAAGYAWFGANNQNQNTSGNSGFLQQNSSGRIYMCAPSGTQAEIQVNSATILSASSTGVTLPGLTGATTRLATINAAGQIGATTFTNDGPWLPTAAGSVHSPGAYSNVGPTLAIGDGQYGLSANGGSLQLWAAPGGYVATTAKIWANGAIGSGVSLSAGGGIMRAYNSGAYGIWGTGVADNNSAYSMAADNNGAWTWINGTTLSALSVGGTRVVTAQASGATLAGTTTLSGLTGATTRLATINAAGQIGATDSPFPNFPILKTVLVKRGTGSQTLYTRNFAANEMNVLGKTIKISFYATALNPAQGDFEVLFGNMSLGHCGIVYGTVSKFEFSFSVETIGTGGKFSTAMVNSNNNGSVYSGADWGSGVNLTAAQTLNFNYSQSVAGTVIINQMSVEIINP